MKVLRFIAEVRLTEKEADKILTHGKIVWDVDTPIASVCGKPVKFVNAFLVDQPKKMNG